MLDNDRWLAYELAFLLDSEIKIRDNYSNIKYFFDTHFKLYKIEDINRFLDTFRSLNFNRFQELTSMNLQI